uniref:Signal transducer and activator of transcription n=1 Tax=Salvator merianae TaxID=96440 RepID=A0A8D0C0A6_SALMN
MAQWQQIQNLESANRDQVHQLYSDDCLPMEVRQYLAYWIEEQNWSQAAQGDCSQAQCLFHTMLTHLDDELGRLMLREENNSNIVLKHNLRRSKLHLQATYQDNPEQLAHIIDNLLKQEQAILSAAAAACQVEVVSSPAVSAASSQQYNIENRLLEMRKTIQNLKCSMEYLEELQDTFDFRFKTYQLLGNDQKASERKQVLQVILNNLDSCRRDVLAQIQELLGRSDTLRGLLLEELAQWQDRQRQACIGAPCDTSLKLLEKWFTGTAEDLFHLLHLLRTLHELHQKMTYEQDPLKAQLPQLEKRLQEQISVLLKSAFVVESQPIFPHPSRRPLVLKTSQKFSVRARLLVKLMDPNSSMEVKIEIDKDAANLGGFRRFNILTSATKTMVMDFQPQVEGLVCDFKHITLREQKTCGSGKGKGGKGLNEGSLPALEELHIITFTLDYCYQGLKLKLQASTLPVVIISNINQMSSAWASILWFIMLSPDPKNQLFFCNPPSATWAQLSSVISWQFLAVAERGLNPKQLCMLGEKLCGSDVTLQSPVTWAQFAKDIASGFSFWTWIDEILTLIQDSLKDLWKNGLIMGFVSRKKEKSLLKKKMAGTFLLRFSETIRGGITCTWVEYDDQGCPKIQSPEPYRREDLKTLALPDIISDYQLLADKAFPENPLRYLYPDIPRDEAFGPYYSPHREVDMAEQRKYLSRRFIRVSNRQPDEVQSLEPNGFPAEDDRLLSDIVSYNTIEELEHGMGGLLCEKQDPFLPQLVEEQHLTQVCSELFEDPEKTPEVFPELELGEEDFQ